VNRAMGSNLMPARARGTRNWKPATALSSLCDFFAYDASNTVLRYTQPMLADGPFPDLDSRRAALPEEKWQATEFWK
jgi:hypothetical protein